MLQSVPLEILNSSSQSACTPPWGCCYNFDAGNGSSLRVNLQVEGYASVPDSYDDNYNRNIETHYKWRLGRSIQHTRMCSPSWYSTEVSAWGIGIGGEDAYTGTSGRAVFIDATFGLFDDSASTNWGSSYSGEALYNCPSNWLRLPAASDRYALLVTTEVRRGGFTGASPSVAPSPAPTRGWERTATATRTRTRASRSRTPSPSKTRSAVAVSKSRAPTLNASRSRSRKRKLR